MTDKMYEKELQEALQLSMLETSTAENDENGNTSGL